MRKSKKHQDLRVEFLSQREQDIYNRTLFPPSVDPEHLRTLYENGLLKLRVPKRQAG